MKKLHYMLVIMSVTIAALCGCRMTAPAIVAVDQADHTVVVFNNVPDWSGEKEVVWRWNPADAPEIVPEHKYWFNVPDECKVVRNGEELLITASGGGAARIRIADKKVLFYACPDGNPHSIELLPDDNIVTASSTGNKLTIYATAPTDSPDPENAKAVTIDLEDAHGVVWDDERQLLWAHGRDTIVAFQYNFDRHNPMLTPVRTIQVPDPSFFGGHDLYPRHNGKELFVTCEKKVSILNPEDGTLKELFPLADVKSISEDADGKLLVAIPEESWWTPRILQLNGKGEKIGEHVRSGARFYKARYFQAYPLNR